MKKILVTGTCGFIFSNFIRRMTYKYPQYNFIGVDKIVEECNSKNIDNKYKLYIGDIADGHFMDKVFDIEKPDIVVNGAAESFVDNSIRKALPFMHSNILGTQIVIDMCLKYNVEKLIQISTDEILGQLVLPTDLPWTENSTINPRNPYSASKASAELLVKAANQTHGLNYIITRCCNNFGPRQHHRNLIPKIITSIINNEQIPIHGNGIQRREWLYVNDHCDAIMLLLEKGNLNEIYNIGSSFECSNLEMVYTICDMMKKGKELISFVKDRPGHDFRYSLDFYKIKQLGWEPKVPFMEGLDICINWYVDTAKT